LEQKQQLIRGNGWFQLREFLELFVYQLCESNGDDYFQDIAMHRSSDAYGMQRTIPGHNPVLFKRSDKDGKDMRRTCVVCKIGKCPTYCTDCPAHLYLEFIIYKKPIMQNSFGE
jgi:hypothetical protein